ncbi:DUF763 domain-containing protein [Flavobacteriaceae bacterium TP-CH-4]|uniref:DUF763 domain-containing protein n=1 Tax=Pelagihabitans pacificus TaxID=2696054 RepID=A0A967E6G2_9FLAO|nr:DUF763 domain-containing protein [Pelagihabitans pacificus]NHF59565.1 DUF763 domain-containing protein [Pelagihabitans pacificus]
MKRSGTADLALYGGGIPPWLFRRMKELTLPVVKAIIAQKGTDDFLERLSDPFWFQSFGAVIGMDWNSSGVTTAVMRALKQTINPHSKELGLYICGGKGTESIKTPNELLTVGDRTGLNGLALARASKLSAKVDNTALQDGFSLYLHNFVVSDTGKWTVVQQGMHQSNGRARRYHWHSENLKSFVEEPHAAVCGENQGEILNLVHKEARATQRGILKIAAEHPDKLLKEIPRLIVPTYCDVKPKDIDLKRLGSVLWLAQESETQKFDDLLLLKGLGPRTLQSLTLVSEIIHGTPSRFSDPARFSFAHGGKNAKPFAVPTKIYDKTICTLKEAVDKSRIGNSDKLRAIEKLTKIAQRAEAGFMPNASFDKVVAHEKSKADEYGTKGMPLASKKPKDEQLRLFDNQYD